MLRHNLVTIDLEAIRHNYRTLAGSLPKGVAVMPVVKADAYGHGLTQVARAVCGEGARFLAVALAEEGLLLRQSGVEADILVLGAATERAARAAVEAGLTQPAFAPEQIAWLEDAARAVGRDALMHIKLDTGMGRIGLRSSAEADALSDALKRAPHVRATALYTHFADADEPLADGAPNAFTQEQLRRLEALRSRFCPSLPVHAANSAASLYLKESFFFMVRQGISLYGYPPIPTALPFRPALRWEAELVHVKDVAAGTPIGYGCAFVAPRDMRQPVRQNRKTARLSLISHRFFTPYLQRQHRRGVEYSGNIPKRS